MLPVAYNCKKCPSQQSANVCLASEATKELEIKAEQSPDLAEVAQNPVVQATSVDGPVQIAAAPLDSKLQRQTFTHLKSPTLASNAIDTGKTTKFFAPKLDDRSNRSFEQRVNIVKARVLAPLMLLHMFNQVPGIGSNSQSLAEFEIKNGMVASIPPSALNFS